MMRPDDFDGEMMSEWIEKGEAAERLTEFLQWLVDHDGRYVSRHYYSVLLAIMSKLEGGLLQRLPELLACRTQLTSFHQLWFDYYLRLLYKDSFMPYDVKRAHGAMVEKLLAQLLTPAFREAYFEQLVANIETYDDVLATLKYCEMTRRHEAGITLAFQTLPHVRSRHYLYRYLLIAHYVLNDRERLDETMRSVIHDREMMIATVYEMMYDSEVARALMLYVWLAVLPYMPSATPYMVGYSYLSFLTTAEEWEKYEPLWTEHFARQFPEEYEYFLAATIDYAPPFIHPD